LVVKEYKVLNVKCGCCANTLISKLAPEFGEVEVDLEQMPRIGRIFQENIDEERLRKLLKGLGYPMVDEDLGFFEEAGTKAKSFVSCAIGKAKS
jgi:copper chaperone